jgi:oligoendopeptidase F
MVVMWPFTMPKLSCSTLKSGAAQLVVHEAFEITALFFKSSSVSFTPMTTVDVSSFAGAVSITFLNYLGSNRDVMTLAHEVGHGVHAMLAGKAQGKLMMEYPMAYAETASVFGEMTKII